MKRDFNSGGKPSAEDEPEGPERNFVNAIYVPRDEDLGINNPLIRALPVYVNSESVLAAYPSSPIYSPSERRLTTNARLQRLGKLRTFFELLTCHPTLVDSLFMLVNEGYMRYVPPGSSEKSIQTLYMECMKKKRMVPLTPFRTAHSPAMGLFGVSGLGKSTSLERALSFLPHVIRHPQLPDSNLQVVWVKVDCPSDGSIKQLFRWLLLEFDRVLGTHYNEEVGKEAGQDQLMNKAAYIARYHHTGILVIDEIQFAARGAARRGDPFMDYFVSFTNTASVPILVCGTPQGRDLMSKSFRLARRICDRGSLTFTNMSNDKEWAFFLKSLFRYQWTSQACNVTREISSKLYDLTQGIHALVVRIFHFAQMLAIKENKAKISVPLLNYVSEQWLAPVEPMIRALQSRQKSRIEQYNDLLVDALAGMDDELEKEAESARVDEARNQHKRNQTKLVSVSDLVSMGVREAKALSAVLEALRVNPSLTGRELTEAACEKAGIALDMSSASEADAPQTLLEIVGDTKNPDEALEKLRLAGYVISREK